MIGITASGGDADKYGLMGAFVIGIVIPHTNIICNIKRDVSKP